MTTDAESEEPPTCKNCGEMVVIECGYEASKHGFCWPCASERLDELLELELPASEAHLRPVVTKTVHARPELDGVWVQATAMGCVRPALARAFASELWRAADEAEEITKT